MRCFSTFPPVAISCRFYLRLFAAFTSTCGPEYSCQPIAIGRDWVSREIGRIPRQVYPGTDLVDITDKRRHLNCTNISLQQIKPDHYYSRYYFFKTSFFCHSSHRCLPSVIKTKCLASSCMYKHENTSWCFGADILIRTGTTGYIGGDVLYALTETFRSSKIMALARNESRASLITSKFPSVIPVIGDLDSTTQIESEASEADVVLRKTYSFVKHAYRH